MPTTTIPAAEQAAYDELTAYTWSHAGPDFVHQHAVDAWTAQHADATTRPIGITFALVGLLLHVDRGWSGRQVQRAHMALGRKNEGRRRLRWPELVLPEDRGDVTAIDVVAASPGSDRDRELDRWCAAVWLAYGENHEAVSRFLREHGYR